MSYECPRCRGEPSVRPIDGRPFKEVEVGDSVLEAVDRSCYQGDMLSAVGGCMAAATARWCAWGKFREKPSSAHVQACAFRPEGSSV